MFGVWARKYNWNIVLMENIPKGVLLSEVVASACEEIEKLKLKEADQILHCLDQIVRKSYEIE